MFIKKVENKMDYLKQAFGMTDANKDLAKKLYSEAVIKFVNKNYIAENCDAHTELSAIFGMKWILAKKTNEFFWLDKSLYAEANVAFNYANCILRTNNKFISLAKTVATDNERINDKELSFIADQLNYFLTATSADEISTTFSNQQ